MNIKNVDQLSANEEVQKLMFRSVKLEWWADDPWFKREFAPFNHRGIYILPDII